jgi:hypothetical protein
MLDKEHRSLGTDLEGANIPEISISRAQALGNICGAHFLSVQWQVLEGQVPCRLMVCLYELELKLSS